MAKNTMAKARSGGGRRSAARLAAVQALYQFEDGDSDIEAVILEFLTHRPGALVDQDGDDQSYAETDRDMFADVARGTARRLTEIDKSLARTLPTDWPVERIEKILRNVMRCGVYELQMRLDVPFRVIINEYVELARDFFGEDEPAMVNAVLDKIARQLREAEQSGE
jgi:N utilization substance protein B